MLQTIERVTLFP